MEGDAAPLPLWLPVDVQYLHCHLVNHSTEFNVNHTEVDTICTVLAQDRAVLSY